MLPFLQLEQLPSMALKQPPQQETEAQNFVEYLPSKCYAREYLPLKCYAREYLPLKVLRQTMGVSPTANSDQKCCLPIQGPCLRNPQKSLNQRSSVFVCVCACVCIYIYIYIHTHTYVCICISMHICRYIEMYDYRYTDMQIQIIQLHSIRKYTIAGLAEKAGSPLDKHSGRKDHHQAGGWKLQA